MRVSRVLEAGIGLKRQKPKPDKPGQEEGHIEKYKMAGNPSGI